MDLWIPACTVVLSGCGLVPARCAAFLPHRCASHLRIQTASRHICHDQPVRVWLRLFSRHVRLCVCRQHDHRKLVLVSWHSFHPAGTFRSDIDRVDRLWAIMPMIYGLHYLAFAQLNGLVAARMVIVTAIQLLWGVRLTFNYWRKGAFEKLGPLPAEHTLTLLCTGALRTTDGCMSADLLPDTSRPVCSPYCLSCST